MCFIEFLYHYIDCSVFLKVAGRGASYSPLAPLNSPLKISFKCSRAVWKSFGAIFKSYSAMLKCYHVIFIAGAMSQRIARCFKTDNERHRGMLCNLLSDVNDGSIAR